MNKLKRAVVKEEFVALTGDYTDAIILNQFIYWSERVRDFDKFIDEEKRRYQNEGIELNIELSNGWIYKKAEELAEETMTNLAAANIRNRIKKLISNGWMDERKNPKLNWDKTIQYRVNLFKISQDLLNLGYILQDYKVDISQFSKCDTEHYETKNRDNDSKLPQYESKIPPHESKKQYQRLQSDITTENKNLSVSPEIKEKMTDGQIEFPMDESYIKKQIGYNALIQCHSSQFIDEIVLNILDMYFSKNIRIKGDIKPQPIIRSVLAKLTHWHIQYVIERYNEVTSPIKNKKDYIQTMIYNSVLEMDAHNLNEVRSWKEG